MFVIVGCRLFVVCYLLSLVRCVLFVADCCAVFVVVACCGLFVIWDSVIVVRCLSFVGCCLLFAVVVVLCVVYCCLVCVARSRLLLAVVVGGCFGRVCCVRN